MRAIVDDFGEIVVKMSEWEALDLELELTPVEEFSESSKLLDAIREALSQCE